MSMQSPCEGCGKQPEVYGSSWCRSCHILIPEYGKDRMCRMRNALINIGNMDEPPYISAPGIALEALGAKHA